MSVLSQKVPYQAKPAVEAKSEERNIPGLQNASAAFEVAKYLKARGLFGDGRTTSTLLIAANLQLAERIAKDLRFFLPAATPVTLLPSWDALPFDELSPAKEVMAKRLAALRSLLQGKAVVVSTPAALMRRTVEPEFLKQSSMRLHSGREYSREVLARHLIASGYSRVNAVEGIGQFAIRGSVLDFYSEAESSPTRLEFFGDEIESMRAFDSGSQRSSEEISSALILPVSEWQQNFDSGQEDHFASSETLQSLDARAEELALPRSAMEPVLEAVSSGLDWPGLEHLLPMSSRSFVTPFDYLDSSASIVLCDPQEILRAADDFEELVAERADKAESAGRLFPRVADSFLTPDAFEQKCKYGSRLDLTLPGLWTAEDDEDPEKRALKSNDALHAKLMLHKSREMPFEPVAELVRSALGKRMHVVFLASEESRAERIIGMLESYGLSISFFPGSYQEWFSEKYEQGKPRAWVMRAELSAGFSAENDRIVFVDESELFPKRKRQNREAKPKQIKRILNSLAKLGPGDFIVHVDYGIGLYRGLKQVTTYGKTADFLELEYAEESKLFLPVDQIGKIQKYSGSDGRSPALTRLGGKAWEKAKAKVKKQVAELAGQLLSTMARREIVESEPFPPLDEEDRKFAEEFGYEETPDQATAIEAVLGDMTKARPMDRLVCGDVGYGKTEVAFRAAFKAANAGRQVVFLVPTTVLAKQHYENFKLRFENTAVSVASLNRMNTPAENKEIVRGLAAGSIDVAIGTHRLLSKDVSFANLGLVIIDEEHRFGVAAKERLKRLRTSADILALSATPIPRTLNMSLVGIRDLSLIETAPTNRQVIRTYVAEYDEALVREAITRELGRSGQVYFIHNRIDGIEIVTQDLRELVPEARIEFAHGRMKGPQLDSIMHRFVNREIDVLVSTTIVESGLDIANANTMLIRKAESFGLAELYQLRGRVGRSEKRAYAYLLVSQGGKLKSDARKRLEVLRSLDDLGVGFRLALEDMEIRGAGNLLGKDQSGNVNQLGYELYARILKDAVEQLRRSQLSVEELAGELPQVDPELKIGFPNHIPQDYVPDVAERLVLYQRLIEINEPAEIHEIAEELTDRFGNFPDDVAHLLEYMRIRSLAKLHGVTRVVLGEKSLKVTFHPEVQLQVHKLKELLEEGEIIVKLSPNGVVDLPAPEGSLDSPEPLFNQLAHFLSIVRG